jgi:hypothetical protein
MPAPAAEPAPTVAAAPLVAETGTHAVAEPEPAAAEPEPAQEPVPAPALAEEEPEPAAEPVPEPEAAEPEPAVEQPEPELAAYDVEPEPAFAEADEEPEPVSEPEPVAAASSIDPWESEPELPNVEPASRAAEEARDRFRFWRRRRRSAEEQALLPEPTGHVHVISVRPAVPPEEVRVPWEADSVEPVEGGRSAEDWHPPSGYERPPGAHLRRGRR